MRNIASTGARIIAGVIDLFICSVFILFLLLSIVSASQVKDILNAGLRALIFITIIHPIVISLINLFLITITGGTIGKLLTGLSIVNSNGEKVPLKTAFFREIVGKFVSNVFFYLGFIWIAVDRERRGWHDMIADTYVVKKFENGIITGLLALIILLGINGYIGYLSLISLRVNMPLYKEAVTDIVSEIKETQDIKSQTYQGKLSPTPTLKFPRYKK